MEDQGGAALLLSDSTPQPHTATGPSSSFQNAPETTHSTSSQKREGRYRLVWKKKSFKSETDCLIPKNNSSPSNDPGPKTPVKKVPDVSELPHNISKSRTVRFHKLFKSVPVEEYPIESFTCAFKGDILLQGQMYVSHNWVCFYSKIKARGRLIEIPFEKIISITREKLALFIPNAIGIQTADQKYVFGSFISRDSNYKKLVTLWKCNQDLTAENMAMGLEAGSGGHSQSEVSTETDTTEDDLNAAQQLGRTLNSSGGHRRVEVEVTKHPEPNLKTVIQSQSQQCLNCKSAFHTFCSFSQKLQKIPRTNLLLAICTILVFFLMLSAVGLTYKILLLQSRLEVRNLWNHRSAETIRDRAMSNLYWLQTETHAAVVRRLHSVLAANVHLLEEVNVLLRSLHRDPATCSTHCDDDGK